jgi:hypothetical protein
MDFLRRFSHEVRQAWIAVYTVAEHIRAVFQMGYHCPKYAFRFTFVSHWEPYPYWLLASSWHARK